MGYQFSTDKPGDQIGEKTGTGMGVECAFNANQMSYIRMIMVEAGVIAGGGFEQALSYPDLAACADTLPAKKFLSNDGWRITAPEAGFVAARLRRALDLDVVADVLYFLDDAPDKNDVHEWAEEFAAFNETAAQNDGYYVY